MRLVLLIVAILLVALPAGAAPADAAPPDTIQANDAALKDQVDRLVQQLDAADLASRDEAKKQLVALGPKILDLLPTSPSGPAQADALESIRAPLQLQLAEQSIQASNVTLNAADQPLSEILAELSRQSGNKLKDLRASMGQETANRRLTLAIEKSSFWQALDQTLDRAHLTVYHYAGSDALGIVAAGENAAPRVSSRTGYAGPLRLEAMRLTSQRDLRLRQPGWLKLTMQIAWEPRLRPIALQLPMGQIHATDDRGEPIAVENPEGQLEQGGTSTGTAVEMEVPLADPPRAARAIASIKGTIRALLPSRIETFEFTGQTKSRQQRAGATVALDEVLHEGATWQVRVRVHYDHAGNALESFRSWVFNNEAYMVGPDNRRIKPTGSEQTLHAKDEIGLAYKFELPNGPGGLKFIYKTPALLTTVPLKFEFKDLPLP
jgi:hypothetical protein